MTVFFFFTVSLKGSISFAAGLYYLCRLVVLDRE